MTFSKLTTRTSGHGGQYSSRGRSVDRFIVHHAATTSLPGVLSMMSTGSREVSSNYVIKDADIVGVVPEEYRAWTSGTAAWDGRSITVETCNSDAGDASGWPISEASYKALSALIADCATRYGFPLDRDHVIGHRELYSRYGASYATACPGGIDLDRIVREARAIQAGAVEHAITELTFGGAEMFTARDITTGKIYRVTAYTMEHERTPELAQVAKVMSEAAGGRGQVEWNRRQIDVAQQIVRRQASELRAALGIAS